MTPHETLFLQSTHDVDVQLIANTDFVRFQTWDFGGELNLKSGVNYGGKHIPIDTILKNSSTIVYVIDAQEDDYEHSLPKLIETITMAYNINPAINFEVFLHKIDSDLMPEEMKNERQQSIQSLISTELAEVNSNILVSYYLTSIYDHTSLEAFSKVWPVVSSVVLL